MSSIICPRKEIRRRLKNPWGRPIGLNFLVARAASSFTTSNIILKVEGSNQEPSPANLKRITLVPC